MSKKSASIPKKSKTVEVIPKDLQDQMGAVQAVGTAFNVLDKGYFPHSYSNAVKASLNFLAKLHEQSVEVALKHPQAHMVPELKEALKTKKAAKDGEIQANQTN